MATYRYKAQNARGEVIADRIEAASREEAVRLLQEQGFQVLELLALSSEAVPGQPPRRLSSSEGERLARHLAQIAAGHLPLASGLRLAAEENGSSRVAAALESIAARLDEGQPLEAILAASPALLPPHIRGLIRAAAGTGQLGNALTEFIEHRRAARSVRASIRAAIAYPLVVLGLALGVLLFVATLAMGPFGEMFRGFGLKLPLATEALFWFRRTGFWWLLGGTAVLLLAVAAYRLRYGRARFVRLLSTMPIFGPLWHWTAIAEWASLMGVLSKYQVPLPESLRLAADGVANPHVSQLSLRLAEGVAKGRRLSQVLASMREFPASLVPLLRWGEDAGALAEAFAIGHELFSKRVRLRSVFLNAILPPLVFITLGCLIVSVVLALFSPMVSLIGGLS